MVINIRLFKLYHYIASGVSIYDIWNLSTLTVASLNFYAVNFYIFWYNFFATFDLTVPDFQYSWKLLLVLIPGLYSRLFDQPKFI